MTFQERNELITELVARYKALHDKHTSNTKQLTDEQWQSYIDGMEGITREQDGSSLRPIAGALQMAFLDDTEYMQKRLKKL